MTNKEQFLAEHNKLSPLGLQADFAMLNRFKEDKISLFKDDSWSIDKLRRPFILWLTSLPSQQAKSGVGQSKDKSAQKFHPYKATSL